MSNVDRVCMRLRQVTETDDAGIKHRVNRFCKRLLLPGEMNCGQCERDIESEEHAAHSVEIQR